MKFLILSLLLGSCIGGTLGFVLYFSSLRRLARRFGVTSPSPFTIEKVIRRTINERMKAYRAAVGVELEGGIERGALGGHLQRIVSLSGEELRAKSVELCLFDSESGLTAQSFIVGIPSNAFSRGSLSDEELERSASVVREERDGVKLFLRPVRFAKKTWGVLQFEFPSEREVTTADEHLIGLYAQRVAVTLLDSQFTSELLRMRQLSEESIQAKTGFLANLSHELRGPLGIILNGTELALDGLCGPLTQSLEETLRMIRGNGQHLLELVNDVLDYAKVEAGKITTKPIEMPLKPLLEDILRVARGQAEQKSHKLHLEPLDETLGIVCDRRHARQMLINFLTNAIKYTPDGGTITVSVQQFAGNRVKISIKDTGVGIPEGQRSKVFGAFERVEGIYAEKQAGTGLGMPLTKRLAEANGGMVDFESEVGKGSTFWLILPGARVSRYASEEKGSGEIREKLGKGERVMILDSESHSRQMLAKYLSDQGYDVLQLSQPKELIQAFRDKEIDLAIVDSSVDGMSAEEIVLAVRAHPKGASIPLLVTTPSAFTFDVENYLKLGVDLCLSKPVDLVECSSSVRRLVDEYHPKAATTR